MSAPRDRRERGLEMLQEIARVPAIEPTDAFMAATVDVVFGELWQRPGIPVRERRMLSLAIVATRGLEFEIETHIRGALESGDLTPSDVLEIVLQVAHYAGWPCGAVMYRRLRAVCAERGLDLPTPDDEA